MMAELAAEAWDIAGRLGFRNPGWGQTGLGYFCLIGVFGVFLPWFKGRDFLDPVMLGVYASLGVVFAAPVAAAAFEKTPLPQRALARVAISVFYGELLAGSILLLGVATVYVSRWGRIVVGPDLRSVGECALLGVSLSLAVCAAATWFSVTFSASVSKRWIRMIFLALLAGFYLRSGWLPAIALRGAGLALLLSIVFLTALIVKLDTPGVRHPGSEGK